MHLQPHWSNQKDDRNIPFMMVHRLPPVNPTTAISWLVLLRYFCSILCSEVTIWLGFVRLPRTHSLSLEYTQYTRLRQFRMNSFSHFLWTFKELPKSQEYFTFYGSKELYNNGHQIVCLFFIQFNILRYCMGILTDFQISFSWKYYFQSF